MVNPFELTFDAIYLTLTGQAPIEAWFPLFRDIGMMLIEKIADILEVLM
ncbi:MAG: hypothetical protein J6L62_02825 [Clostridia bacterium]|nr:hypothetical protein [Clostridia bacterium]